MKKYFVIICVTALVCAGCGGGLSVDDAIKQVKEATEKVSNNPDELITTQLSVPLVQALATLGAALEDKKVDEAKKAEITEVKSKWDSLVDEISNPKTEEPEVPADSLKTE